MATLSYVPLYVFFLFCFSGFVTLAGSVLKKKVKHDILLFSKCLLVKMVYPHTIFSSGYFQFNQIPLPILNMNKIVCFVGSFSKIYSQSLFSAYTSYIYGPYL